MLDNPSTITDTTGAEFEWVCDATGCVLGDAPTPPPDQAVWTGYVQRWDRLFMLCGSAGSSITTALCRALACAEDADCPQVYEDDQVFIYSCRESLCQNIDLERFPADHVSRSETYALCAGVRPREDYFTDFFGYLGELNPLVEAACGELSNFECPVPLPDGCLQP